MFLSFYAKGSLILTIAYHQYALPLDNWLTKHLQLQLVHALPAVYTTTSVVDHSLPPICTTIRP